MKKIVGILFLILPLVKMEVHIHFVVDEGMCPDKEISSEELTQRVCRDILAHSVRNRIQLFNISVYSYQDYLDILGKYSDLVDEYNFLFSKKRMKMGRFASKNREMFSLIKKCASSSIAIFEKNLGVVDYESLKTTLDVLFYYAARETIQVLKINPNFPESDKFISE